MKCDTRKIKEILKNAGDKETFDFSDKDGFAFVTPWGLEFPEITIRCCNSPSGKVLRYVYDLPLMKFLEDSLIAGKSYAELDEFLWKLLEVRISVRNIIRNDPERYERVRESVLKYHKENIIEMEDFNLKKEDRLPSEVRLAEVKFRARMAIMSRLDKEFKNTISEDSQIATIITPKKDGSFIEFRSAEDLD